jgi:hypothetical protein
MIDSRVTRGNMQEIRVKSLSVISRTTIYTIGHSLNLELRRGTCSGLWVTVEFLAGDDTWQLIRGARAQAVFPNSYQVTFLIAPAWTRHVAVLEAMTFRIEGRICSRAYVESADGTGILKMTMLVEVDSTPPQVEQ